MDPEIRPTTITRNATSIYKPLAMLAGMQLDVFTPLANGPMSAVALAKAIDVRPEKLRPLLYALVHAELLTVENDNFVNTAEADAFLVRGRPAYMGGAHELYSEMWQAALVAGKTIRTGTPQARHDYASMPAADLAGLFRGLHPGALATGRFLAKEFRLERFEHLMDVGGGSGGAAIAACQACANLRATVVELPNTATIARSFIDDANLASRVKIMACDVIREVPKDACDAAVMRNVVQVLAPDEARRALKHVGTAMRENGELFIVGSVLDDNRLQPDTALGLNLVYLGMYENGQSYTEAEHRAWLAEAGFSDIRVSFGVAPNGATVIAARKSGAMGS